MKMLLLGILLLLSNLSYSQKNTNLALKHVICASRDEYIDTIVVPDNLNCYCKLDTIKHTYIFGFEDNIINEGAIISNNVYKGSYYFKVITYDKDKIAIFLNDSIITIKMDNIIFHGIIIKDKSTFKF